MAEVAPACETELEKYDFEFYDYADVTRLGVTDDFFYDGNHGGEVAYGYIIQDMIENGSKIADYIDIDKLNFLIDNAYNELTFENPDTRTIN